MQLVPIEIAQANLPDLINGLSQSDEVVITQNDLPVARLARANAKQHWACKAGSAKGKIKMSDDFDAPLEEFREYT